MNSEAAINAVPAFIEALEKGGPVVRESAIKVLSRIKDDRALEPLITAMIDESIRDIAEVALLTIDPNWKKTEATTNTVPKIINALSNGGYYGARRPTWDLLNKIDPNWMKYEAAKKTVPYFLWNLDNRLISSSAPIDDVANVLLNLYDYCAVEPLILMLNHKHSWVQESAFKILVQFKDIRAVEISIRALKENFRTIDPKIFVEVLNKMDSGWRQFEEAKKNIENSMGLAKEINLTAVTAECHHLLAELYELKEDHKFAYHHFKLFHNEKDKTYQRDIANRVKVLELSHHLKTAKNFSEALQEQNDALREEVRLRKQTQAKLEEQSRIDPLTGIFNRRYFFELAEREFTRARRYKRPVSAIMIDLDHFKTVNDNHGHLVGDQVLAEVANRIQENSREVDIVGRYGGEEFIILLPETALDDAVILAERIWTSLTTRPASTSKITLPLQASLGVSCCIKGVETPLYDLIEQADSALYRAKDLGRNRIEVYRD